MDEDYYGDEAAPSEAQSAPETKTDEVDESGEQTALVDSALSPGLKVGDEFKVKVVAVHDAEYELAKSGDEEKEDEPPKSVMDESTGNLDRLARPPTEA